MLCLFRLYVSGMQKKVENQSDEVKMKYMKYIFMKMKYMNSLNLLFLIHM